VKERSIPVSPENSMKAGAAHVDITPAIGGELSGFALRVQPSTGVSDPLFARALYLTEGETKLLWLHCDLIGFDAGIPARFREWARAELGLSSVEVLLSATHTHSGPCTLHLAESGRYDGGYVAILHERLKEAARQAMQCLELCTVTTAEGQLNLATHRRDPASAHTDSRVGIVGFQREDRTFIAVIANYSIHPVALGHQNRHVSADLFGSAAAELRRRLPGGPVSLVTNGACGNLNPPSIGVEHRQVALWGQRIADAAIDALRTDPTCAPASLHVAVMRCALPLDTLDRAGIDAHAEKILAAKEFAEWSRQLPRAVEQWRRGLLAALETGAMRTHREIEIFAVGVGPVVFVAANAELFSDFTDLVRTATGLPVYTVGYANGNWGYIATRSAYKEGGYEVESAHVFYGGYRFKAGGLEQLANETAAFLRREFDAPVALAGSPSVSTTDGHPSEERTES
jgi:neutral ceramidase